MRAACVAAHRARVAVVVSHTALGVTLRRGPVYFGFRLLPRIYPKSVDGKTKILWHMRASSIFVVVYRPAVHRNTRAVSRPGWHNMAVHYFVFRPPPFVPFSHNEIFVWFCFVIFVFVFFVLFLWHPAGVVFVCKLHGLYLRTLPAIFVVSR